MMERAALIALGYFSGSIPFGVLVARWVRGVDVRTQGSGNIGATNVARVAGKKLGVAVLALDALKGALPVLLTMALVPNSRAIHAAVGLAAFLGHVFPVWLRFKGGKGVATALGVLAVLAPWAALAAFVVYAFLFGVWRISSIGSLAGGITALIVAFATGPYGEYKVLVATLFALMLFTHRGNVARILRHREKRL
jgi:glycerol-3-phosphate acyltransferase PlsY